MMKFAKAFFSFLGIGANRFFFAFKNAYKTASPFGMNLRQPFATGFAPYNPFCP